MTDVRLSFRGRQGFALVFLAAGCATSAPDRPLSPGVVTSGSTTGSPATGDDYGIDSHGAPPFLQDPAPAKEPAPAQAEENTGQDLTRPLTRVDLRYKIRDDVGDGGSHVFTVRADKPIPLGGGGWSLATRADLPFVLTHDTPDDELGLSDALIQALAVTPPQGPWAYAFGTQVILPTATDHQLGAEKYQLVPTVAAIRQVPEIRPGSFYGVVVRNQFSFAGDDDRRDINELLVQPVLNVALPDQWFVTISPEMRFDLNDGMRPFIPLDVTVGCKVKRDIVMSAQLAAPLIDDYAQYESQIEFRVGFFF